MLKLDPNQKSYTMKMEDLFTTIENIVAHPHFSVTSHDKQRAAQFQELYWNNFSYENVSNV